MAALIRNIAILPSPHPGPEKLSSLPTGYLELKEDSVALHGHLKEFLQASGTSSATWKEGVGRGRDLEENKEDINMGLPATVTGSHLWQGDPSQVGGVKCFTVLTEFVVEVEGSGVRSVTQKGRGRGRGASEGNHCVARVDAAVSGLVTWTSVCEGK